jgi:hypothetical protein
MLKIKEYIILIKKYFYKITHYQTKLFKKNNPIYIYKQSL